MQLVALALALTATIVPTVSREAFDATQVRIISTMDVATLATLHDRGEISFAKTKEEGLAHVRALSPDVRTLFWLMVLEAAPRPPGTDDYWLWPFLAIYYRYAPEIETALAAAGMPQRARILTEAAALLPRPFALESLEPKMRSALETSLRAPSAAFGTKETLDKHILDFVAAHAEAAAWIEARRQDLGDEERFDALVMMLPLSDSMDELATYPEPYRVVSLAYSCYGAFASQEDEFTSMSELLSDHEGTWLAAAIIAFRTIGRSHSADQLERAVAMMPKPYPATKAAREAAMRPDNSALAGRIDELRGPLGRSGDKEALVAFAKRQGILPH